MDLGLVLALVRAERAQQSRLGVRKLYYLIAPELKAAGVKLGRDRLFAELGKVGLLVERKPSEWPRTTKFNPALPVFKNLIKRCPVTGRNQVWVADITYIRTQEGFLYLGLITDKWSRKIVGFHLGETLETGGVLKALAMALRGLKGSERPIHHSDRGSTYASTDYRNALEKKRIECSMSRKGDCWDNAVAESFFASLKREMEDIDHLESWEAANISVGEYIDGFYNPYRRHSALNYNSPIEFELIHSVKKAA